MQVARNEFLQNQAKVIAGIQGFRELAIYLGEQLRQV